tara:strand:- start:264 stop:524 length:261 start_codon:yes stop_codon:yes gene_type:complete
MTKLHDFTLEELMIFCASILGAVGVLLKVVFTSKCKTIDCCCMKCDRDVDAVIKDEKLQLGRTTTPTIPQRDSNTNDSNNDTEDLP